MIQMLISQFLTPDKMADASLKILAMLKEYPLQENEMTPTLCIVPHGEKLYLDIITMKVNSSGVVLYSRNLLHQELSADFIAGLLKK